MKKKNDLFFKNNLDEFESLFLEEKKPFVLFLGAGVNGCYPNMSWDSMLNNLLKKAISILSISENLNSDEKGQILKKMIPEDRQSPQLFNSYFKASIIKKVLGNQYVSFIQNNLYSNCNRKVIEKSIDNNEQNILICVAEFVLKFKNIEAVVTYNYDDFLGNAISLLQGKDKESLYRRIEPVDIYRSVQKYSPDANNFPIYHVHGFIPPPDKPQISVAENVVLAYDEYFNNIMEPFSWQTTTQLHFLNNYNILFIGASLEDWNMLRALSISKKYSSAVKHFALFTNSFFSEGQRNAQFINRIKASVLADVGVNAIFTETDNHNEIFEKLANLKYKQDENEKK